MDRPENYQTTRKFSSYPDYPETFRTIRTLSRLSRKFPECPETFQAVRKLSILSGNFPDHPETWQCNFQGNAQKLSGRAKTFRTAMPRWFLGLWVKVYDKDDNTDYKDKDDID